MHSRYELMIKTARQEERSRQETAVTDLKQRLGLPIYIHTYIHTYQLLYHVVKAGVCDDGTGRN